MANLLTALRLLLAAPVAWAFYQPQWMAGWLLLALLLLAIATDMLDGIVARSQGTASGNGQLFDHGTDCLFVTAGLAGCAAAGLVPAPLPLLIVVAFSQYVLDSRLVHRQKRLRMSALGRWNGILYYVPLVIVALARIDWLSGLSGPLLTMVNLLAYALLLSTILSILDRALATRSDN